LSWSGVGDVASDMSDQSSAGVNSTTTHEHLLTFNVSSVGRDEDIYLAELRLQPSLHDLDSGHSIHRVSVYELGVAAVGSVVRTSSSSSSPRQIASKLVYGASGSWETFTVTDAVKRWVRLRATAQVSCGMCDSMYSACTHNCSKTQLLF